MTWYCVGVLAFLSLLPAQDMVRTGFPGEVEHFAAYAGSGAIAMAGYGLNRGAARVIGCFWLYAGILEYLQHFSPGRHRQNRRDEGDETRAEIARRYNVHPSTISRLTSQN